MRSGAGFTPLGGREADPFDERRRIHFAAAEDASGGSGGCAASTPQLNEERSGIHSLGAAKQTRLMSGGEFTSPPRKTRAGGLGGAPLAPPSSMSVFLLPALRPLVSRGGRRGRPRFGRPRRTRLGVLRAWRGVRPAAAGAFARLPPLALAADLGSAPGGSTFALTLAPP